MQEVQGSSPCSSTNPPLTNRRGPRAALLDADRLSNEDDRRAAGPRLQERDE